MVAGGLRCCEACPPAGTRRSPRAATHGRRAAASPATVDRNTCVLPRTVPPSACGVDRMRERSVDCAGYAANAILRTCATRRVALRAVDRARAAASGQGERVEALHCRR